MREPKWRETGEDPDYRFSLANERTFLAWIRTALAILAGGVLLEEFSTRIGPHWVIVILAVVLGALATVLAVIAYVRWRANEIAMRQRQAAAAHDRRSAHRGRHPRRRRRAHCADRDLPAMSPLTAMRTGR